NRSTSSETFDSGKLDTGVSADVFKYGTTSGISFTMSTVVTASVTTGSTGDFIAAAAGNVDNDTDIDAWSVSSRSRDSGSSSTTGCGTGNNPAGEPCNDFNDV